MDCRCALSANRVSHGDWFGELRERSPTFKLCGAGCGTAEVRHSAQALYKEKMGEMLFKPIVMSEWCFAETPVEPVAVDGRVSFTTRPRTYFWNAPENEFANGHFYFTQAILPESFGVHLQCSLHGNWKGSYDQAGIMLKESNNRWIKAGIEYINNKPYLTYPPQ
jgi:Protein of unknown function (DUF1349)